jgi:predicted hydrocarbon binding protein
MNGKQVAQIPAVGTEPDSKYSSDQSVPSAQEIRRSLRRVGDPSVMRQRIAGMYKEGLSPREMYEAGQQDGSKEKVGNLTDILYRCQECGLGRMSIMQESNSHLVIKVFDCACCHTESEPGQCHYLAGFLAGSLVSAGRPGSLRVKEVSCGEYPGRTCVFMASW